MKDCFTHIIYNADYYPFGMPVPQKAGVMPGRQAYTSDYRFGFNGMESDNEIYGNWNAYTAEYWEYDPRLGRRWNRDPVVYSWQSSYATFNNNPIYYMDPLGLEGDPPPKCDGCQKLDGVEVFGKRPSWFGRFFRNLGRGISSFADWWKNADSYSNFTFEFTYGAQAGRSSTLFGLKDDYHINLTSETWFKFSAEQRNHDDSEWDIDFEYMGDDDTKSLSEGFAAGRIGGYEYKREYDFTWKGENRGDLTEGVSSEAISLKVINITKNINNDTKAVTYDANVALGAKLSALFGLEIKFTLGVKDKK